MPPLTSLPSTKRAAVCQPLPPYLALLVRQKVVVHKGTGAPRHLLHPPPPQLLQGAGGSQCGLRVQAEHSKAGRRVLHRAAHQPAGIHAWDMEQGTAAAAKMCTPPHIQARGKGGHCCGTPKNDIPAAADAIVLAPGPARQSPRCRPPPPPCAAARRATPGTGLCPQCTARRGRKHRMVRRSVPERADVAGQLQLASGCRPRPQPPPEPPAAAARLLYLPLERAGHPEQQQRCQRRQAPPAPHWGRRKPCQAPWKAGCVVALNGDRLGVQ